MGLEFKDKFVAYVDVLGFKGLVEAAERQDATTLQGVLAILEEYGSSKHRRDLTMHGPRVCPGSSCIERHLDFRATAISDCVVVSCEVSPSGVITLVHHCWALVLSLLAQGVMCRGFITRGNVSQSDTQFVGTGYHKALQRESAVTAFKHDADERGTPFVEVDPVVCEYIQAQTDACVLELFRRQVKKDGELVALFPFRALEHSFVISGHASDRDRELRSNQKVREMLIQMKVAISSLIDHDNADAVGKGEHYIHALDVQLQECDRIAMFFSMMSKSRANESPQ